MSKRKNRILGTFAEYRDVLVRGLLRLSVRPSDVDDILQESLTRTLEANETREIDHPKSYLFTVSRNIVFRDQERSAREVQWEIDEAILESHTAPIDRELYYKQMLEVFWEALETLPQSHRRAILLRRVYGFSHKQVAKKMGLSVNTVEKYFARGIKRCQDVMAGRGYGVEFMGQVSAKEINKKTAAGKHARNGKGDRNE
ncbi:RNA polymerase sigma factor [Kordiimonas sp.]|uniref:RNA polymerase sigma factor n=1 Tax=Kordiimonas sp. TaxID=1970157 RepID=UPI003A943497